VLNIEQCDSIVDRGFFKFPGHVLVNVWKSAGPKRGLPRYIHTRQPSMGARRENQSGILFFENN
jgi:hypothetical protein